MTEALSIQTAHADMSEVVRELAPAVDDESIRLPSERSIADGEWVRFTILLADGTSVFEGVGRSSGTEREGDHYRVMLTLLQFDERNEIMYERMLLARDAEQSGESTGTIDLASMPGVRGERAPKAESARPPPPRKPPPPPPKKPAPPKSAAAPARKSVPPARKSVPPAQKRKSVPPQAAKSVAKPAPSRDITPAPKAIPRPGSIPPPRAASGTPHVPPPVPARTPSSMPPRAAPLAARKPSEILPPAPSASAAKLPSISDIAPLVRVERSTDRPPPPDPAPAPPAKAEPTREPRASESPRPARDRESERPPSAEHRTPESQRPMATAERRTLESARPPPKSSGESERPPRKRRQPISVPVEDAEIAMLDTVVSRPDDLVFVRRERAMALEVAPRLVERARALAPTIPESILKTDPRASSPEEAVLHAALKLGLASLAALADVDEDDR
jgi:hypothetical protein